MRRSAFVLLTTLIVGLSTAGPAQGYWSLFHSPHHLPHPKTYHFHHHQARPVQPLTPGQVIGAIQFGHHVIGQFLNPNPNTTPAPAPEPRISQATSNEITETGKAVDTAADNVNKLLKLVRDNDKRHDTKTLPDVPKTGAAPTPSGGTGGTGPTPGPGTNPIPKGSGPTPTG